MYAAPFKPEHQSSRIYRQNGLTGTEMEVQQQRCQRGTPTKKNVVVNKSMPSNMRGPVYNAVEMVKLHWRIQIPVYLGEEEGKPAYFWDTNSSKKTANCFRRGLAIGHKIFTPDQYFASLKQIVIECPL